MQLEYYLIRMIFHCSVRNDTALEPELKNFHTGFKSEENHPKLGSLTGAHIFKISDPGTGF
jgi:hypothetical protein